MRSNRFVTAWLHSPSLKHYLFLDDDRTRRVVIEPRVDNDKIRRSSAHCGYSNLKKFDLPHKHSIFSMLLRKRFFVEQLWVPRNFTSPHSVFLS